MTVESIAILGFVIFVGAVLGSIAYDKLKAKAAEEKAIRDAFLKKREELLKSAPPKPLPYNNRPRSKTVNPFSSTTTTTTVIQRGGKTTMSEQEVTVKELLKMIEDLKKNI